MLIFIVLGDYFRLCILWRRWAGHPLEEWLGLHELGIVKLGMGLGYRSRAHSALFLIWVIEDVIHAAGVLRERGEGRGEGGGEGRW